MRAGRRRVLRRLALAALGLLVGACAAAPRPPAAATPPPAPAPARVAPAAGPATSPVAPRIFESDDFVVTFAQPGDTPESFAARFLGDAGKAWMITDYDRTDAFAPGQEVVIPRHAWNPSGVEPAGYQIVPVLAYYNLAPEAKGRLVMAARTFEAQMRYLKAHDYHVLSLQDLLAFTRLERQLPRRAVVVTFNDGWRSFRDYAYPVLKDLGFSATLFVYTDFVGARSALSWDDLRGLAAEGFDVELESKTHGDLRQRPGESDADYAQRLDAELAQPRALLTERAGVAGRVLAYPYGAHDDAVERAVQAHGYAAAFDVRRQANPSFAPPFALHRAQIYADLSLAEFAKNLEVFNEEPVR